MPAVCVVKEGRPSPSPLTSENSPLSPTKCISHWSDPKVPGKCRSSECTPLNFATLQQQDSSNSTWQQHCCNASNPQSQTQTPLTPSHVCDSASAINEDYTERVMLATKCCASSSKRPALRQSPPCHSLRGVLQRAVVDFLQVPFLRGLHAGDGVEVKVVPVDEAVVEGN